MYIKREFAQTKIKRSIDFIKNAIKNNADDYEKGLIDGLTQAIDDIAYIPSADVVERETYEHKWHKLSMKELELEKENHELKELYDRAVSRVVELEMTNEDLKENYDVAQHYALERKEELERKRGKWGITSKDKCFCCSNCHELVIEMPTCMDKPLYDYCPNCGCQMNGEKE